jgi:hypothetical protein
MTQSIQYELENAINRLVDDVSGVNIYTANRTGKRLMPYITIQASINNQLLGNFTGVYDLNVAVNYSDTAAKISQEQFDEKYCQIFESLYEESPSLATRIQDRAENTKIYMARIVSQTPSIRSDREAWVRGLTINVLATPDFTSDGLRSYDFSEDLNSFYIATI